MSSSRPRIVQFLFPIFAALLLAACGSGDGTSVPPRNTAAPVTPMPNPPSPPGPVPSPPPAPPPVTLPPAPTVDARTAMLSGAQESPAVVTQATGKGAVVVDQATHEITGGITFSGLTPVSAGIYSGAPGTNGLASVIELTLQGSDTAIIPPGRMLSAGEYAALLGGTLYFNVRTATNPRGEIRGQITGQGGVDASVETLSSAQEVTPAVISTATGKGTLVVDSATKAIVIGVVTFQGVDVSPNFATAAQIQIAPAGSNGAAIVPFTLTRGAGFATAAPDATLATDPAWYAALLANGLYFNVASNNNQGGEIRGQIQVDPQGAASPPPPPPPPPPAQAPTLTTLQNTVFNPVCTSCHGGRQPSAGMSLVSGSSFANLVNVASSQNPSLTRVIPGNANDSLLIHKLEDANPPVGAQMPRGRPPLPQATIDMIRAWIDAGAMNN